MARRARGEGSIDLITATGKWRYRVTIDGRMKAWIFPTKGQAAKKAREIANMRSKGVTAEELTRPRARITLNQYLDEWLAEIRIHRPRSYENYGKSLKRVRDGLGDIRLIDLGVHRLSKFFADLRDQGTPPSAIRKAYDVVKTALNVAVKKDILPANPLYKIPKPRVPKSRATSLTTEEARKLLLTSESYEAEMGILAATGLLTGARIGELTALTWDDVNFAAKKIIISKSLCTHGAMELRLTKTPAGNREVPISDYLAQRLRRHQAEQTARFPGQDIPLVFTAPRSGYIYHSNIHKMLGALLREAKVRYIRFHDLRHTCGSHMIAAGVNVLVVSRILGHSSPAITLGVYGHVLSEQYQEAVEKMHERIIETSPRPKLNCRPVRVRAVKWSRENFTQTPASGSTMPTAESDWHDLLPRQ